MPLKSTSSTPTLYDFRRPHKFNREHLRALQIVGETYARRLASSFSTTVRAICEVTLDSVSQITYDEYIRAIPNPASMAILALPPLPGTAALHFPLPVLMEAIDRLLGGPGGAETPERPLTEIEQALARTFHLKALRELAKSFDALVTLTPELIHQEANPQFAQVAVSTDLIVQLAFQIKIGEKSGLSSICIPYGALLPALDEMSGHMARTAQAASTQVRR